MAIIVKDEGKAFVNPPEGLHQIVCADVVDLGIVHSEKYGDKPKVSIRWQTEETYMDEETKNNRRYLISQIYTKSLNKKAKLRQHLESWRGKKFTDDELKGFDLEALVGVNGQGTVIHNKVEDTVYANIQSIVPLLKGTPKIQPTADYVRVKDRKDQNNQAAPAEDDDDLPF